MASKRSIECATNLLVRLLREDGSRDEIGEAITRITTETLTPVAGEVPLSNCFDLLHDVTHNLLDNPNRRKR